MQRKAASFLSGGNKSPAERSRLLQNRIFQNLFFFWDYPMTRMNQFVTLADMIAKHSERGEWGRAYESSKALARWIGGAAAQGTITAGIMTLFGAGMYGLKIALQEAEDEKAQFAAQAYVNAVGGPAQVVVNGLQDAGLHGVSNNLGQMIIPTMGSYMHKLLQAATGTGTYRDMNATDRMMRFLKSSVSGWKFFETGLALELLHKVTGNQDDSRKLNIALKAFYKWRRQEFGGSDVELWLNHDFKKNFRIAMRKALDAKKKGDEDGYDKAIEEAHSAAEELIASREPSSRKKGQSPSRLSLSEQASQSVSRSLESSYLLKIETAARQYRDMTDDEKDRLRKHIGDDPMERLEEFDRLLDIAAAAVAKRKQR